jgi:protein subunit release factor B
MNTPTNTNHTHTWELEISAGAGPVEVRRFVAALATALIERCGERGLAVIERRVEGDELEPRSVSLCLQGQPTRLATLTELLADQLGTHELVDDARRSRTGRHRGHRKRWFAGVRLHRVVTPATTAPPLDPADVELRCDRSGGPGGQHVNTTSSAVRARHRPTQLAVRVSEGRSQHHNKTVALARLAELVAAAAKDQAEAALRQRHAQHQQLHRGDAVACWRWTDKRRRALERHGQQEPRGAQS